MWVEEYLKIVHGSSEGSQLLNKIDHRFATLINVPILPHLSPRISLVPLFPGLQRFKQGQNFQQWTGNDSKAFMKVCASVLSRARLLSQTGLHHRAGRHRFG
jgi:hypothetical protein